MTIISNLYKAVRTPYSVAQFFVRLTLAIVIFLLIPLTAMQFTDEVNWSVFDFIAASVLLMGAGMTYKLVSVRMSVPAYRRGVGIAVGTSLVLIWINLAVGIIGSEDHPANLMYFGVLAVGFTGVVLAQFRPHGMYLAMTAMAAAQFLVPVTAFLIWRPELTAGVVKVFILNWLFVMLYIASVLQFRKVSNTDGENDL
jgi:hypothetical protein